MNNGNCKLNYLEKYHFDAERMIILFKYDRSYAFNYRNLIEYRENPNLYDNIWHLNREIDVKLNKNY